MPTIEIGGMTRAVGVASSPILLVPALAEYLRRGK
jgi:hypothetical protein